MSTDINVSIVQERIDELSDEWDVELARFDAGIRKLRSRTLSTDLLIERLAGLVRVLNGACPPDSDDSSIIT